MRDVVIVGAKRTPIGDFLGGLKELKAVDLGVVAVKGALEINIKFKAIRNFSPQYFWRLYRYRQLVNVIYSIEISKLSNI